MDADWIRGANMDVPCQGGGDRRGHQPRPEHELQPGETLLIPPVDEQRLPGAGQGTPDAEDKDGQNEEHGEPHQLPLRRFTRTFGITDFLLSTLLWNGR